MKLAILAALALSLTATPLAAQSVAERSGNIVYTANNGTTRTLTSKGGYREPVLSPDGRQVAFIHIDVFDPSESGRHETSLWVADVATGKGRRLIGPSVGRTYEQWMRSFSTPIFSMDGRSVYVSAAASEVSALLHRIDVATGKDRYVIDGYAFKIVRSGPYRGALFVSRHKYQRGGGAHNPVDLVLPSGKVALTVPGTHWGGEEADQAIVRWLRKNRWTAS